LETTTPPTLAERDIPLGLPGFTYQDLHDEDKLADLDRVFLAELTREEPELAARLTAYRKDPASFDPLSRSRLLVEAGRPLARFIAHLFGIEREWQAQAANAEPEAVLFRFRRDFLTRRAAKTKLPALDSAELAQTGRIASAIERDLFPGLPWDRDPELATAQMGVELLQLESDFLAAVRQKKIPAVPDASRSRARELGRQAVSSQSENLPRPSSESDEDLLAFLEELLRVYAVYCHARFEQPDWKREIAGWPSFHLPESIDYQKLVVTERPNPALPEQRMGPPERHRRRDGFGLTDHRMSRRQVLGETHYCLLCHEREKDSCSKGFFDAKTQIFQKNPLGVALPVCPLAEKIS